MDLRFCNWQHPLSGVQLVTNAQTQKSFRWHDYRSHMMAPFPLDGGDGDVLVKRYDIFESS